MTRIEEVDLQKKRVLLRVDFDVPIKDGRVADDFRILSSLPTIKYLLEKRASLIIISHLGRPEGRYEPALSLRPIANTLSQLLPRVSVRVTDDVIGLEARKMILRTRPGEILVLGNIRFQREEELDNQFFAGEIAKYGQIYINDAFACTHRFHASVHAITQFLPSYPGFLIETELYHLNKMVNDHLHPYIAVIGGAKVKTKLPALKSLLPKVDKLLLGGAIANTFLRAKGIQVGQSLLEASEVYLAEDLLTEHKDKILLPEDWRQDNQDPDFFRIMDIGSDTIVQYRQIISEAKTIFWNGDMGVVEQAEFAIGTKQIALAITNNPDSFSLAGGGDTISAIGANNLIHSFDFISTGGGATLEYLAGEKLPALVALGLQ